MKSLVKDPSRIRLGVIGMTPGNGHPYSWSAIFNGYDRDRMTAECPFAGIPVYLNKVPAPQIGIAGAKVTAVYCDRIEDARHVAALSLIETVVERPEQMIGQVDAVLIATDIGGEHVRRARPFIDAGVPVFIDKPLCDNAADLEYFRQAVADGAPLMSSSAMRYAKEFVPYHRNTRELGELRLITMPMAKYWETYGIHALESIYPIVGPGFTEVRNFGSGNRNLVHLRHRDGVDVFIGCIGDACYGGAMNLTGTAGNQTLRTHDTYTAFRNQLVAFVDYLKSGARPFDFSETAELMELVIGAIASREQGGIPVAINVANG